MTFTEAQALETRIGKRKIVSLFRRIPGIYDAQEHYYGTIEYYAFPALPPGRVQGSIPFITIFANEKLIGLIEPIDASEAKYDTEADPYFDVITLKNPTTGIEYRLCVEKKAGGQKTS
jgi:hypothetical protein